MPDPSSVIRDVSTRAVSRLARAAAGAVLAAAVVALPARADSSTAARPPFKLLHQDEDWSSLCDPARRTTWYDAIKCTPLDADGSAWLSVGGEVRERYEHNSAPLWGAAPRDDYGVMLQRYVLHGDLHLAPWFRLFAQLYSAYETGRPGSPRPTDENRLDLQQGFVELRAPVGDGGSAALRLGRQEINYGSARLIAVREGSNIRRNFDGGLGRLETGGWRVDAIAFRPTFTKTGTFDDGIDSSQALWGVYAVERMPAWLPVGGSIDLYYLGYENDAGTYDQGVARESRHSIGTRLWGKSRAWDWNWELTYQLGTFGSGDIRAWRVATDTGYTLRAVPWMPRLGLSADVASGDDDPTDPNLGTFNAMFPLTTYFSELPTLGPRNYFNAHPWVTVHPIDALTLSVDADVFWRLEQADGIYSPSGALLRSGAGSNARYVATDLTVKASWHFMPGARIDALYTHDFPGAFIRQTGPSAAIDFVKITFKAQF